MDTIKRYVAYIDHSLSYTARLFLQTYRLLLSPWLGWHCRFYPSCSMYSLTAYQQFCFPRATWLTLLRLSRCHPWHQGGIDECPTHPPLQHVEAR